MASEKTYVVNCSVSEPFNPTVIVAKVDDTFQNLGVRRDNFLFLLSDSDSYMTVCTAALQTLPLSCDVHRTCLAQLCRKDAQLLCRYGQPHCRTKAVTVKNKSCRILPQDWQSARTGGDALGFLVECSILLCRQSTGGARDSQQFS